MKKTKWYLQSFGDYHEIPLTDSNYKSIEIGCFPVRNYGYCRYFGLFYKGRRPKLQEVYNRLIPKISVGDFYHYRTNENIGYSPGDIRKELRNNGLK